MRKIREMHQEDMVVDIPSSIVGRRNQEVQATLRDAQEFVGAPGTSERAETTRLIH